ncbi:MAG: serine/threonine protein kinase [Chloroflexota bacterium]|nr:serine/threonine protein kinase [Chloroflexota bacterium]MDE3192368.1 serine/threonine protein kinase [Chloroflexota bacterium]
MLQYEVGQLIDGRYEVLASLGQGGMGASFRARDRSTGREVVVKIPSIALIGDPGTYSRYQRELEIARRLAHPRLQNLVASGQLPGGAPYMVLEYHEGRSFREVLSERGPLPVDEAVALAAQLAETMEHVHQHGVVHRDLKPENLLLTREGDLVVLDFGIAFLQGARRLTFHRLTSSVGTPDYMAPEQVSGERGDARTDVYAIGAILYEMLTGRPPFQGDNALAVMGQRLTSDPRPPRELRPEVSPQLDSVVRRALRRDRADRYPSAAALCEDLLHLDAVVPDEPGPTAHLGYAPRGDLPPPRTIALILVVVFGVLGAIGVLAELAHRAQGGQ